MIKKYLMEVSKNFCLAFEQVERCKTEFDRLQKLDEDNEFAEEMVSLSLEWEFWEERYNVQKNEIEAIIAEIQDKDIQMELTIPEELFAVYTCLNENDQQKENF